MKKNENFGICLYVHKGLDAWDGFGSDKLLEDGFFFIDSFLLFRVFGLDLPLLV